MMVAFVGIERPFKELPVPVDYFVKYHLEIPWYYANNGSFDVVITTKDMGPADDDEAIAGENPKVDTEMNTSVFIVKEPWLKKSEADVEVVVHWRKWFQWAYDARPDALHIMHCCDHSFGTDWRRSVGQAIDRDQLRAVMVFYGWHAQNTENELDGWCDSRKLRRALVTGLHLGVDTKLYYPKKKDRFRLLWASDPGRGFGQCFQMFQHLKRLDHRYEMDVLYPDYVNGVTIPSFPGVKAHHYVSGEKLWDFFRHAAFVPYTSTFPEPSSRVHRQGQSCGSVVLYPEKMGTPSDIIAVEQPCGVLMRQPFNPEAWAREIISINSNDDLYEELTRGARRLALREDWSIQAERFSLFVKEELAR
jgi:glycosyltransferase involved in cell wall biosynthesis